LLPSYPSDYGQRFDYESTPSLSSSYSHDSASSRRPSTANGLPSYIPQPQLPIASTSALGGHPGFPIYSQRSYRAEGGPVDPSQPYTFDVHAYSRQVPAPQPQPMGQTSRPSTGSGTGSGSISFLAKPELEGAGGNEHGSTPTQQLPYPSGVVAPAAPGFTDETGQQRRLAGYGERPPYAYFHH
jgi:hypothetical protein